MLAKQGSHILPLKERRERADKIVELHDKHGVTFRGIASRFGISNWTANKHYHQRKNGEL